MVERLKPFRNILLLALVGVLGGMAGYAWINSLKVNSFKSEAQVMLSYLGTLEAAYHTDSGSYAGFEQLYGSEMDGQENCRRPEGAEELGFRLKRCGKNPKSGGLRYAYRVLLGTDDYRGEAVSGSDISSESYVCLNTKKKDQWKVGPDKKVRHVLDCE